MALFEDDGEEPEVAGSDVVDDDNEVDVDEDDADEDGEEEAD